VKQKCRSGGTIFKLRARATPPVPHPVHHPLFGVVVVVVVVVFIQPTTEKPQPTT